MHQVDDISSSENEQTGHGKKCEKILPAGERFVIEEEDEYYIKKFGIKGKRYTLRAKEMPKENGENTLSWILKVMKDIHAHIVGECNSTSNLIGVSVDSDLFAKGAFGMSLRPVEDFSLEDFLDLVASVTQSNESFQLDESFIVKCTYVDVPTGSGAAKKNKPRSKPLNVLGKRSFVSIRNDNDNLCLPRALVVGEAHVKLSKDARPEAKKMFSRVRDGRRSLQRQLAIKLVRDANVRVPLEGCGYNEIDKFQSYYDNLGIAILVFDSESFGNGDTILYDGRKEFLENKIYILYNEEARHYDVILNLSAAVSSRFFCEYCNKKYAHVDSHMCDKICSACFVSPKCDSTQALIKCERCSRDFFGDSCFANHNTDGSYKAKNKKLCDVVQRCKICLFVVNKYKGKHECGYSYCRQCTSKHNPNELCYMQPIKKPEKKQKYLFVFYDFETRQDSSFKQHVSTTLHVPVMCVVQMVCTDCLDNENMSEMCNTCGVRQFVFTNDPVAELIKLTVRFSNTCFANIITLAHNMGSFDGQFILRALIENYKGSTPSVILNGGKIISIRMGRTKFLDSLNYFNMKLSNLPATFGLPATSKKGYFPHYFTSEENMDYVGDYPDSKYYGPDSMAKNEREKFFEWYECQRGKIFNMREEMTSYCISDVQILRQSCLAFRKMMLEIGDTDPFVNATTIASSCSYLFRKKFLKPKTIGLVPPQGYRRSDRHSQVAVSWLLWCERELGREIIHAGRCKEFRLKEGFRVDGFLPPLREESGNKGTVFEFQGCFMHGCTECYKTQRDRSVVFGRSMDEVFENTRTKITRIKSFGYEVREMWECEFNRFKNSNPDVKVYLENHSIMTRSIMNPREGFFGGRTEVIKPMCDIKNNEKIMYTDICSLYPFVCKTGLFPLGHPEIFLGSECNRLTNGNNNDLSNVHGLIKANVLAPRSLFLPLLPIKMHNRLLFALCRSCAEELREDECDHEDIAQRSFVGVWCSLELQRAVELGYEIIELYIIWQYQLTRYDPQTEQGGLFAQYVNCFLKIKQEASGWPSWCTNEEEKEKYIREYKEKEGIQLQRENIKKIVGKRSLSKILLNAFYGKFGQRSCLPQAEIVKTKKQLLELLFSPEKEVTGIIPINQEIIYVCWRLKEEADVSASFTNIVIAIFVTAQARLVLYSYLEKLGTRSLYCDTDSTIFLTTGEEGEYTPPLGSMLGCMTNELESFAPKAYIISFVSTGPKSYAMLVYDPEEKKIFEICKVKGITLNYENSGKINYESVKKMVKTWFDDGIENDSVELAFRSIRRTKDHFVVTKDEKKTFTPVFKKRWNISSEYSLPFGYKR